MGGKGEIVRNRIVETAKTLFHLKGYTNTSVDEIVRRASVTKGNLYHYFASKEELGSAVIDQVVSQGAFLEFGFASGKDPVRQILSLFHQTARQLSEMECRGGCLFGNLALEVSDLHDVLRERVKGAFSLWEAQLERLLEDGRRRGALKADLDAKAAAQFIIAVFEGGILLAKVKKDVQVFRDCTGMVKGFLDGLRAGGLGGSIR